MFASAMLAVSSVPGVSIEARSVAQTSVATVGAGEDATTYRSSEDEDDVTWDGGGGGSSRILGSFAGRSVLGATRKGHRVVRRKRVGPGMWLLRIKDRRAGLPQRIFALKIDLRRSPSADIVLSNEQLAGFERTSSMARRAGAIAAVNGDFGLPSGRPMNDLARNGALDQTRRDSWGWHFGLARGEGTFLARRRPDLHIKGPAPHQVFEVRRWNDGRPQENELAVFSSVGQNVESPPNGEFCSARLRIVEPTRWRAGFEGVETVYEVERSLCPEPPGPVPDPAPTPTSTPEPPLDPPDANHIVISAQPESDQGAYIAGLLPTERVTLGWSMWAGTLDAMGGIPLLLKDGQMRAASCSESLCRRHPRTGVGVTRDGKLVLAVVDGRRKKAKGMTLVGFAREMARLGAVSAINLDGGGSSTMWVRGKIVNKPSDGSERAVSSAIVILPHSFVTEPQPPPAAPREASSTSSASGTSAVNDPASTGGVLDALVSGALGNPVDLPAELDRLVARFRAATAARESS